MTADTGHGERFLSGRGAGLDLVGAILASIALVATAGLLLLVALANSGPSSDDSTADFTSPVAALIAGGAVVATWLVVIVLVGPIASRLLRPR